MNLTAIKTFTKAILCVVMLASFNLMACIPNDLSDELSFFDDGIAQVVALDSHETPSEIKTHSAEKSQRRSEELLNLPLQIRQSTVKRETSASSSHHRCECCDDCQCINCLSCASGFPLGDLSTTINLTIATPLNTVSDSYRDSYTSVTNTPNYHPPKRCS